MAHPVRSGVGLLLAVLAPMGASALLPIPGGGTAGSRFDPAIASGRGVLQRLVDAREAPGVSVGVAVDGRVVWTEGFSYADVERRVAATKDTRFGLGSISKTLTMAAVMRLVDEGRLDLDAPVEPVGGPTHRQLADGFLQALDTSSSLPSPAERGLVMAR